MTFHVVCFPTYIGPARRGPCQLGGPRGDGTLEDEEEGEARIEKGREREDREKEREEDNEQIQAGTKMLSGV